MAAVETLQTILSNVYNSFLALVPGMVFAAITLVIGYVIGRVFGTVVERVSEKLGIDKLLKGVGALAALKLSLLFGALTKWTIYIVFIVQAINLLGVQQISAIMNTLLTFIPGIVAAVVILLASYVIAAYVQRILGTRDIYTDILGKVLFFLIIFVGIAAALPLVNLPTKLIDNVLLVIIASVGGGLALAIGLGLRDTVDQLAKDYIRKHSRKHGWKRER